MVLFTLICTLIYSPSPLGVFNDPFTGLIVDEGWYFHTMHHDVLEKIIDWIPVNASVATQNDILPHLTNRMHVYLGYKENVDYILVDLKLPWARDPNWSPYTYLSKNVELLSRYGIVMSFDGIILMKLNYSEEMLDPTVVGIVHGLKATYWGNTEFSGDPVYEEYVLTLDINWGPTAPFLTVPADRFSAIMEGYLYVSMEGNYTFRVSSDDGFRLFIDDELVLDGWQSVPIRASTEIYLKKGYHSIRIFYVEYVGNAAIKIEWRKPGSMVFEVIPPDFLYIKIETNE